MGYVVLIHVLAGLGGVDTEKRCHLLFDLVIYADSARCDERRYDVIHNVILFVLTDLVENISRLLRSIIIPVNHESLTTGYISIPDYSTYIYNINYLIC